LNSTLTIRSQPKLLLIANDPLADVSYQADAARDALPYYHRKLPDTVDPVILPDLGPCETASQIVQAQAKVMQMMSRGQLPPATGKTYIESLALMARTMEVAAGGPGVRTLHVVGGLPNLQTEADDGAVPDPPVDSAVVPLRSAG
jgi:hypothetical protein